MRKYEYKVVPVPAKCLNSRDAHASGDPVAFTIETILNDMGVEGWVYVRTDRVTLQKGGIIGRSEVTRDMLVFRRQPVMQGGRAPEAPVAERQPLALLPAKAITEEIEQVRARRVQRPDLLEGAKAGKRRITPRAAIVAA